MGRGGRKVSRKIHIDDWDIDDANLEELAAHGISFEILDQVGEEGPRFRLNKKHRAATHQMIGPDHGGRFWVICIVEVKQYTWRPVTGWAARNHEIEWHRRSQ